MRRLSRVVRLVGSAWLCAAGLFASHAQASATSALAPSLDELGKLSLEELADIEVTSVSKRAEAIGQAASSVYVITNEDIRRSGARSVPEALRIAPNLQVAQTSASRYVVTARGMGGAQEAQNFANKLLVLIDGRTVYSPLFSGVYWDMQDVLLEDVDRIEVISGPGATLWGANAVNGVVNIITRNAAETQGGLVALGTGTRRSDAGLRFGGRLGEGLAWRVYAKSNFDQHTDTATGGSARDHWQKPQAGFRFDWAPSAKDAVTLQGDAYSGFEAQPGAPAEDIDGHNLTARWSRTAAGGSTFQLQGYYDRVKRGQPIDGSGFQVDAYDLDLQHGFNLGPRHEIVWGGGLRSSRYDIAGSGALQFSPAKGTLNLYNFFAQDTVLLTSKTRLVLGAKVEDDPYVGAQFLPNLRLSFTPGDSLTLWGAVSRAVRSPTPFDRDVVELVGGSPFLIGGPAFQPEKVVSYEVGVRGRPSERSQVSLTGFYADYDDLRSIEIAPGGFLPLRWGNGLGGHSYGVEAWGDYQLTAGWRLSASLNYLDQKFRFDPASSKILGVRQVANDPKYQAQLKSSVTFGKRISLDAALRYRSALPEPRLPAYVELNGRLAFAVTESIEVAVSGQNLLHETHQEYSQGTQIPRVAFVDLQWRF